LEKKFEKFVFTIRGDNMFKRFFYLINGFRIVMDFIIIVGSFVLAYLIRFYTPWLGVGELSLNLQEYSVVLLFVVPINILGYKIFGLYDSLRTKKFALQMRNIFLVNLISLGFVFIYLFLSKTVNYSRLLVVAFFVITYCITVVVHFIVKKSLNRLRIRDRNLRHVVVVGAGNLGEEYAAKILAHQEYGYEISAFFDDDTKLKGTKLHGTAVVGGIDGLESYLKENFIDLLVIALPNYSTENMNKVINIAELYGVKSQIIPNYYSILPAKPRMDDIDGIPLLHTRFVPLDNWVNKVIKRTFDIFFSALGLIALSPFLLITAIIVKLTSPGPIVYKQVRVGYNRKEFNMFKFRSMKYVKDAKPGWTTENDDRKTKFGEFMRRNNVDELLQLFNVFKGDMTLVGPRPEQPAFVKQFMYEIPKYMIKHHVKPGITGWAQINGWRGDTSIEERIKCDIYYIENWSFGFDIKIMMRTVFKGKTNAY